MLLFSPATAALFQLEGLVYAFISWHCLSSEHLSLKKKKKKKKKNFWVLTFRECCILFKGYGLKKKKKKKKKNDFWVLTFRECCILFKGYGLRYWK